jgi:hypothetical protein
VLIPQKNGWLKRHDFFSEIFEKMGYPVWWKQPKKKEKHHQRSKLPEKIGPKSGKKDIKRVGNIVKSNPRGGFPVSHLSVSISVRTWT